MIQLEVPIEVSEGLPNGAFGGAYCGPNIRLCSGLKSNSIFPKTPVFSSDYDSYNIDKI